MKVATWNLARSVPKARRRHAAIAETIRHVAADVWVLTETHDSVIPGLDFQGVSTVGSDRPSEVGERWTTIWSRFPLEPLSPTSDPVRTVAARVLPPHGAPLIVYGTVLPWLGSRWRGIPGKDGRAFAAALACQESDWKKLQESHHGHDLIVAGDFNQDLSDTHYYGSAVNRLSLAEALTRAGLAAVTGGAADPVRLASPTRACIDHVCISKTSTWKIRAAIRWPDLPHPDPSLSDHFGIVIEFSSRLPTACGQRRRAPSWAAAAEAVR